MIITDQRSLPSSNPLSFLDAILNPLVNSIVILKPPSGSSCFNSSERTNSNLPSPAMLAKLAQLAKLRISDGEGGAFGGQRDLFGEEDETTSEEEDESMEIYGEADIDNSLESIESMKDDLMESSLNLSTTSTTSTTLSTTSSSSILETDCPGSCNFLFVDSDLTDEVNVVAIIIIMITRPKLSYGRQGLAVVGSSLRASGAQIGSEK